MPKNNTLSKNQVRSEDSPPLTDHHFDTLYELLMAINHLPHVRDLIEAYMRGRGHEDPTEQIETLHKLW